MYRSKRVPLYGLQVFDTDKVATEANVERVARKNNFTQDHSIPLQFRATPGTYTRSGYDKGHCIPAADMYRHSPEAGNSTFLMSK